MAKPKLSPRSKTVALVVHVPSPFKKKIVQAAERREIPISQFVRESLERVVR